MYSLFMMYLAFSFALTGIVFRMAPGQRGGKPGRRTSRAKNRALKYKFELTCDTASAANKYAVKELMAPSDGIWNRIEVRMETDNAELNAGYHQDCYFGVFMDKAPFDTFTDTLPLACGPSIDGNPDGNSHDVHLGLPMLVPLYISATGDDVKQISYGDSDMVFRAKAGENWHFMATVFDTIDDQITRTFEFTITVYFSMQTDLSRFQDTIPVTGLVTNHTVDRFQWKPPAQGKMYGINMILFNNDLTDDIRGTIGFNMQSRKAAQNDYWIEVTNDRKSIDFLMATGYGKSLFLSDLYVDDKGLSIVVNQEGDLKEPPILFTGFFAPNPGTDVRFRAGSHDSDLIERIPFPMYIEDMDVSIAWTTASAGTEIINIDKFDAYATIAGSNYTRETSQRLFSYITAATSGQDRFSEPMQERFTFGDILWVDVNSAVDKYVVLFRGNVAKHNFGIRPCKKYVQSPYLVKMEDVI